MMNNENWFWDIIARAAKSGEKLYGILFEMGKDDILQFQTMFVDFSAELQDESYTGFMEESEDGVEDVANWVVSNGKNYYHNILDNPELIPYSVEDKSDEILYGVADSVFLERFGKTTGIY